MFFSRYIVYTKIFQWFNLKSTNWIGQQISCFMNDFTNKAPFIESDIDRLSIARLKEKSFNLGYNLEVDNLPLNAGTISLVFRGKLTKDNTTKDVVIKILRNGIVAKIDEALKTADWFFGILNYIPILGTINIRESFNDARENLVDQTDFATEIKNIEYVHKSLKNYKKAKTVYVYRELCSDTCIIMDFVNGKSMSELTDEEKRKFIEPCAATAIFMNYKKMIFHLDMHPGNILFVEENGEHKVCYLDMGMIMKTTIPESEFLFNFMMTVYSNSTLDELCEFIDRYKNVIVDNSEKIHILIEELKNDQSNQYLFSKKDPTSISLDISKLIYVIRSKGFIISKSFNKLLIGVVSFLGLFSNLDSEGLFRGMMVDKLKTYSYGSYQK